MVSSPLFISNNKIANNRGNYVVYFDTSGTKFSHNLVTDNEGGLRLSYGVELYANTITRNQGAYCMDANKSTMCVDMGGQGLIIRRNNIYGNYSSSELRVAVNNSFNSIQGQENYWGSTDPSYIENKIYDFFDNINLAVFNYSPFLLLPEPTAPPIFYNLSQAPFGPVGIQRVTFTLSFSAPMDQSKSPKVTFGPTAPFNQFIITENAQWLDDNTWKATYDITSLVLKGIQTISVSGANDLYGMEIPLDTRFSFTVDYAGQITDQTPPTVPVVFATGKNGDVSFVEISWSAFEFESTITGYRYAIGSAPGATDIVNWTNITGNLINRNGLGLVYGRQYWVSVQARNIGGLWSTSGYSSFVAGEHFYQKIFLPIILNN